MDSEHHSSAASEVPASKTQKRGIGRIGWIALGGGALALLLAIGILPRLQRQAQLQAAVKASDSVPSVNIITPHRAKATAHLVLPGTVLAVNQTTIYARTNGYLRRWLVDIGDRVQEGQLLAEIESPETDQQVAQARAELAQAQANLVQKRAETAKARSDLQQARANLELARQTWQRWQNLVRQGVVTQQDTDERQASYKAALANVNAAENTVSSGLADVGAAEANVNSSKANLWRFLVLQSFEKVKSPFTGVIAARNVDSGSLIVSGSSNNNTSLYTIAAYKTLNINVNVPQTFVQSIQVGQTAQIQVRELPQRIFTGKVVRTTTTLDPNSRTLLTQMVVPNQDYVLRPGMYASVKFDITRASPPLMVPANVLVINSGGTQVATVTKDQTVHYQKVGIGRDYGTEVEITSGLSGNESLITNPTVDLGERTRVQVVASKQ